MKSKSAAKINLKSYDDLFGIEESSKDRIVVLPLSSVHDAKDHPFRVVDDESMMELAESIKKYGVLNPGLVRPSREQNGKYELIAGHRRKRGSELAGLSEMPFIIRDLDDDEFTIAMVDTNIQREDILPSEKAHAYKMKYKAMKHQGSKGDKYTADLVGEAAGESGRTVQRYIRLAELIEELLDYVDKKKISMLAGEKLSYISREAQRWILDAVNTSGVFPSKVQSEKLKRLFEENKLTEAGVYAVLVKKEKRKSGITISAKKVRITFRRIYNRKMEQVIFNLLEEWKQ